MMTYKDTLLFIAKCLTISSEENNISEVEQKIKSQKIDWDKVVQVSTKHYVFPALYCNLNRANFLQYLPDELVNYMIHITDLNRERNQQIIEQAKEINELLLSNNITPIFLKGTAFLLEDLYQDIAERMVGDIDFLVSKDEFERTVTIFKNDGYKNKDNFLEKTLPSIHFPKMTSKGKISAIEIHNNLILPPYEKKFNYNFINSSLRNIRGMSLLSIENEIIHNCVNKQISDKGIWYKSIALRNSYDLFLLSQNSPPLDAIKKFGSYHTTFNVYLGVGYLIFKSKKLVYEKNKIIENKIKKTLYYMNHPILSSINKLLWKSYFLLKSRFNILVYSFYKKDFIKFIITKITDINWLKKFFLGIKQN